MGMKIQIGKVLGREILVNKDHDEKPVILMQTEITAPEDLQTVEMMSHTGEDNNPPVNSRAIIVSIGQAFKIAIATDDIITPVTAPGEKRLYSTDEDNTEVRASIHIFNDGHIRIENSTGGGYCELSPGGVWKFNDATITLDGDVITAKGVSLNLHTHSQPPDSAGHGEAETNQPSLIAGITTGPPVLGTPTL